MLCHKWEHYLIYQKRLKQECGPSTWAIPMTFLVTWNTLYRMLAFIRDRYNEASITLKLKKMHWTFWGNVLPESTNEIPNILNKITWQFCSCNFLQIFTIFSMKTLEKGTKIRVKYSGKGKLAEIWDLIRHLILYELLFLAVLCEVFSPALCFCFAYEPPCRS